MDHFKGSDSSFCRGAQFSLNNVHKRGIKHHNFISFRSAGAVSKLDRQDHRAPDSASPAWKAPCITAAVTFADDVEVNVSTPSRSSPIEELTSPATESGVLSFATPL